MYARGAQGLLLQRSHIFFYAVFAMHNKLAKPRFEPRGSSLVSVLRPWARQPEGRGRIAG